MKFKKGDWVMCVKADDERDEIKTGAYCQLVRDEYISHGQLLVDVKYNGHTYRHMFADWFELWQESKPEKVPPDQPTLTDFQKLRLETALRISIHTDVTEFSEALADADMLINLVITTPFKPTND